MGGDMDSTEVSEQMQEKGFHLCRGFLNGTWAKIEPSDFLIEPLSGGLSNQIYMCRISDKVALEDGEPRVVLVRIYGQIIQENPETVVTDSVIFSLLAEKKMGPKLYGVFTGGRVEEYVKSRHLHSRELSRPDISEITGKMMARFHQLVMPIVKEPKWLFDTITRYIDEALNNVCFNTTEDPSQKEKLQKLLSYGLASEFQCLRNILKQVHSPVVFCHNDLQEGNILISENKSAKGFQLTPIDFEYASYNYRGFDIANHFCEWCYDYEVDEMPGFTAKLEQYPSTEQQLHFIRAYLGRGDKCHEKNAIDPEEQQILHEVAAFAMASDFMWGIWSMVQAQMSKIRFGYLDYALARFDAYFYRKKLFSESSYTICNGDEASQQHINLETSG